MIRLLRGIRGAITVETNDKVEVIEAVQELLLALTKENTLNLSEIAAAIFSSTPDLTCAFPAAGARIFGWSEVPLFGTVEIDNPDALAFCVRVLLFYNTDRAQNEMRHVYLRKAIQLRPDISLER